MVFPLTTALGWLERRRQRLFREWAEGAELSKLDDCGGARLVNGLLTWSVFASGKLEEKGQFEVKTLKKDELLALGSGEAPLTDKSQGGCRMRLISGNEHKDVPFAAADGARRWIAELKSRSRCEL